MQKTTTITSIELRDDGLVIGLDFCRIILHAPTPHIIRLRMQLADEPFVPPIEAEANGTDSEVLESWKSAERNPTNLILPIGRYQLCFANNPFHFQIHDGDRQLIASLPGRTLFADSLGRHKHYQIKQDHDLYFGLGEKSGTLLRNSRSFRMGNVDAVGYDPEFGDPLYKHIPFYMKYDAALNHTVGIYLNNAYPSRFDFGSERSGYWGSYTSVSTDGGDLDLFFLLGPTPRYVLQQYHQVTGYPALPTKASLGYMGSTMYYTELPAYSDEAVLGFIEQCQNESIPISGFHLSSGYTTGDDGKRYVFNWNADRFPDPHQFVRSMSAAGQALSPNIKPGLLTTHPLWKTFDRAGAFIRTADGKQSLTEKFWGGEASFVDFSNPQARELWKQHLKSALLDLGVESIWNDNNEFELDDDLALCDNAGEPTKANALRPLLSNQMAATAYEALAEQGNLRPFVLSRAGFSGLQKYAQTWSGDNSSDWRNFDFNIATMLGMSLSGMPFNGMDVGGFTGPAPTPELFLRWVQNGVFHPRFSIHSVNSDNTVTEPWLYPLLTPFIRRAIRTRYLFLPTLYSLAAAAHFDGEPVVAPLFYHFPEYEVTRNVHRQFMLGESLMAVAVTEPEVDEISVDFPPSQWRCFYTGKRYAGETRLTVQLIEEYSPLFYRDVGGFFLDSNYADAVGLEGWFRPNSLIIHLSLTTDGSLQFYDDDGKTLDFQSGAYLLGHFDWRTTDEQTTLTFDRDGTYQTTWDTIYLQLDVPSICPLCINLNGNPLKQTLYHQQLAEHRWYFDAERKRVLIALSSTLLRDSLSINLNYQQGMTISIENEM